MDVHTPKQRSKNMRAIKSKDTKPELILRKALWKKGYRYFKNYNKLLGKPDIVFVKAQLAIFVDGEFWHGYEWEKNKDRIKTNNKFWVSKIEKNMKRDQQVNYDLKKLGWKVMRFWSKDIEKNLDKCVLKIETHLQSVLKK